MELWIARDLDNTLNLYTVEPYLDSNDNAYAINEKKGDYLRLLSNLFIDVTFENSPQKVKIELIKE